MPRCLISFGGNLGDRDAILSAAATDIANLDGVDRFVASRLYATAAIGGPPDQPPFLNAVASLDWQHSAADLLNHLQHLEAKYGRVRNQRWAARSIDLDVILFGDLIGDRQHLALPHPRYAARRFVVEPAVEVAADMVDPRFGWSIAQIAEHLSTGVPSVALIGGHRSVRENILSTIARQGQTETYRRCDDGVAGIHDPKRWVADWGGDWDAMAEERFGRPTLLMRLLQHPTLADPVDWFDARASDLQSSWPSPHQLFSRGRGYPEYGLEVSDVAWAASEIASALDSMQCSCEPLQDQGDWPLGS